MAIRTLVVILTILALAGAPVPSRADDAACWQLVHKAIEASAQSTHSPYVSYAENESILADGNSLERSSALITYRDDGMAYVDDDRWVYPFVSNILDPGPPVLGPYGDRRRAWLDLADMRTDLPIIATTQNPPRGRCTDEGNDVIDGVTVAHLVFPDAPSDRPALLEVWLDRSNLQMVRAYTRDHLGFWSPNGTTIGLANYHIEIQRIEGYNVLKRISWKYRVQYNDQSSLMTGEYRFSQYRFGSKPPTGIDFAVL